MKTVTTLHPEVGYICNIEVIEDALKAQFGFDDASHVLRAVAAHIWSHICGQGEQKQWTSEHVLNAIAACEFRLHRMTDLVNKQISNRA